MHADITGNEWKAIAMIKQIERAAFVSILLLVQMAESPAQHYRLEQPVVGVGMGENGSGRYRMKATIGHTEAGVNESGTYRNSNGFWYLFNGKRYASLQTMVYAGGWNMLSLPMNVPLQRVDGLYPLSRSFAFLYDAKYRAAETVRNGEGFWLKFSGPGINTLMGELRDLDSVDVRQGWNMIGSISSPVPVTEIISSPPGIVTSRFFSYKGQYMSADTIIPGYGYWVKVNQSGRLILTSRHPGGVQFSESRIRIELTGEFPPPPPDEVIAAGVTVPKEYMLQQNSPNPFNPVTTLKYSLPSESRVTLRVYNLIGEVVTTLINRVQPAGYQSAEWDASAVASGVYFYRLEAASVTDPGKMFTSVKKMLLVR